MKEYKHIFDALVEGRQVQFKRAPDAERVDATPTYVLWLASNIEISPEAFRIKPSTIMIGDMEVPEPCREPLELGETYFVASVSRVFPDTWEEYETDRTWLKHGLIHTTKEAAELCRVALIKVSGGEP